MDSLDELRRALDPTLDPIEILQEPAEHNTDGEKGECITPVPDDAPKPDFHHPVLGDPSRVETYNTSSAEVMGFIARYELPGGKKLFLPYTWWSDGNCSSWRKKRWPGRQPLYGLNRLAAQPAAPVVVCEGEKSADAAQRVFPDSVAITSPGGAKAAKYADWTPLTGRTVMVWPDNDVPGYGYARDVVQELAAVGAEIVTVVDTKRVAENLPSGENQTPPEGWDAANGLDKDGWQPGALASVVLQHTEPAESKPTYISFGQFRMNRDGLFARVTKGRGESAITEDVWISTPFEVIGRARAPNGSSWSRRLRWRDPDGRCHEHIVTDAALHSDPRALAADLASCGLVIARAGRSLLCDYLNQVIVRARVTTVDRTGWHLIGDRRVFVLPDTVIGQLGTESVTLIGAGAAPYSRRGTLQDWREGVGQLSTGQGLLVLAVSTAFAGPLVDLVGGEAGGLHFRGDSSSGKSTLLNSAASVWGRGATNPGFVRSWRATANAHEASAALVNDTLLCLDELGVAEGRDAAAAVYQLVSGIGKGRSSLDGSMRAPMTWRVLMLSTGELPMAAKIEEDKQRRAFAGQKVRLLDIEADAGRGYGVFDHPGPDGDPTRLAEALRTAATSAYGEAGPAFVRELINIGLVEARKLIGDLVENFVEEHVQPNAHGQIRRVATRLGLISAAGELARTFNIVPWAEGEAEAAAAQALTDWIRTRGGTDRAEVREAIAQVRRFFEAHGESRFELADKTCRRLILNRAGWRRGHGDTRVWLVLPEMWKSEVCSGLDPVATARILAEQGMLKRDGEGKLQRPERTPAGLLRVYVITAAVFDGGSDAP